MAHVAFPSLALGPNQAPLPGAETPDCALGTVPRRRRYSLRAQTHLPGTVEDVVLFVFPGIEQHHHTPGGMS